MFGTSEHYHSRNQAQGLDEGRRAAFPFVPFERMSNASDPKFSSSRFSTESRERARARGTLVLTKTADVGQSGLGKAFALKISCGEIRDQRG